MGVKIHPLLPDPPQPRQGKHLKPPGIREDRAIPGHKSVKPSQRSDNLIPGPYMEMIGIGQFHLRMDLFQILRGHGPLNGRRGSYIHKNGGLYYPVDSGKLPPLRSSFLL